MVFVCIRLFFKQKEGLNKIFEETRNETIELQLKYEDDKIELFNKTKKKNFGFHFDDISKMNICKYTIVIKLRNKKIMFFPKEDAIVKLFKQ